MQERTVFSEADLVRGGGGGGGRGGEGDFSKLSHQRQFEYAFIVGPCSNRETLQFSTKLCESSA